MEAISALDIQTEISRGSKKKKVIAKKPSFSRFMLISAESALIIDKSVKLSGPFYR